ncbi:MAG: ATP-dependent DNA helicase RecG, partial [Patescibacteria group bacterium]|nr:ATP-dependent DNA helicase RecG [Patescibacteria group bacterium]
LSLGGKISDHFRITPVQRAALARLGIQTVGDLLYHFPVRYGDTAEARNIGALNQGDTAVVFGKITGLKTSKGFKTKMTMADGYVEDETGRIHCVWFNQPYVAKMYVDGMLVRIEGKVSERRTSSSLYFSNPKIERVDELPAGVGDSLFGADGQAHTLYPVYPESRGVSSSWIYHILQKIFKSGLLDEIAEPIPADILKKYNLPSLKTALIWIHTPLTRDDALSARKRFSFEEIFIIQLGKQRARKAYSEQPTFAVETDLAHVREFVRRFPFTATGAQIRAIETILADMKRDHAMSRLLEGDVGSGKTAVAAATAYAVMTSRLEVKKGDEITYKPAGLQIAYMCPTEILATQHFESFIQFFSYMPVHIGLITGSGCRKFPSKVNPKGWTDISRAQFLKWVENGEIAVVIGTHALIQTAVKFKNLAYVIIDEQHRFGTAQRAKLVKKESKQVQKAPAPVLSAPAPHLLSMTATPIPRTLALTMFGDLDLTLLDESPAGRKPIATELVLPSQRHETYEKVRHELIAGRQAYVICPRIDEPDPDKEAAVIAKSVKEEAKRLQESVFPEYSVGILHSKMSPKEKDRVMQEFKLGKIHILCATSVVEVGVNVPNATVIIIEGAERFGLSQLHQLRGRVMRSSQQAYCYAFTETNSAKSVERLKALVTATNGFELAELDLSQRGAGQLSGAKQWGVSDIAMEALQNLKMVEAARTEAFKLIEDDPSLAGFPVLAEKVALHIEEAHFE